MFVLFLDDEVVDYLVEHADLYANRDNGEQNSTMIIQDMRTFLAILMLSGYNSLPRRQLYWKIAVMYGIKLWVVP